MFHGDMDEQGTRLMSMLDFVIKRLDRVGEIVPQIESLGRRHDNYGVRDEHYDTVGAAFLWRLETGLGEAFTDEIKGAWTRVYTTLADTMRGGAQDRAA